MIELADDPVLSFLADQFRQRQLFFSGLELRELLKGSLISRTAHVESLIQRGAIQRISMIDRHRATLFGLLESRKGSNAKPLFSAVLRALKSERQHAAPFKRFGWSTFERHAVQFNDIEFPDSCKEQHVYNSLYLLDVVRSAYSEGQELWAVDTERLEHVLDVESIDELLAREASVPDKSIPATLHLFADTNVFIQCAPLESLDVSICGDFAEVHLIVCRPVQREIDNQKKESRQ